MFDKENFRQKLEAARIPAEDKEVMLQLLAESDEEGRVVVEGVEYQLAVGHDYEITN